MNSTTNSPQKPATLRLAELGIIMEMQRSIVEACSANNNNVVWAAVLANALRHMGDYKQMLEAIAKGAETIAKGRDV